MYIPLVLSTSLNFRICVGLYAGALLDPQMQVFPGMWFSHAGQLASVQLVVQPSPASSLARVQILRPYCNPNHHLVPPGAAK